MVDVVVVAVDVATELTTDVSGAAVDGDVVEDDGVVEIAVDAVVKTVEVVTAVSEVTSNTVVPACNVAVLSTKVDEEVVGVGVSV